MRCPTHPTRPSLRGLTLIAPQPGCSYELAAFDRRGIVAFEACSKGARPPPGGAGEPPGRFFGRSYLVQFGARRRLVLRLPLPAGANPGAESQGQATARPARDRVREFDGRRLRVVATSPPDGDAVVSPESR